MQSFDVDEVTEHHNNCQHLVRNCKALSVKEVAEKYNLSTSTIRRKYKAGQFPVMYKLFGRVMAFECWTNVFVREQQRKKASNKTSSSSENLPQVISYE